MLVADRLGEQKTFGFATTLLQTKNASLGSGVRFCDSPRIASHPKNRIANRTPVPGRVRTVLHVNLRFETGIAKVNQSHDVEEIRAATTGEGQACDLRFADQLMPRTNRKWYVRCDTSMVVSFQ